MNNILLLASQSYSRRRLLGDMQVPFVLLDQFADEGACDIEQSLDQVVIAIAKHKMAHVMLPHGEEGRTIFVLTADTLTESCYGELLGKPVDYADACRMLAVVKKGVRVGTGFCLEKKVYRFDQWQTEDRVTEFVAAECMFDVPETRVATYLKNSIALRTSGAIVIEDFGAQFLKTVKGSYSTIMGLPLFELRNALHAIGFFHV